MQNRKTKVVLVGMGGYGQYYLQTLLDECADQATVAAVVEPHPENSSIALRTKALQIPVFPTIEKCFSQGIGADLCVIVSPIHLHVPQCCQALEYVSFVFCEKPVGATIQSVDHLIEQQSLSGKKVMIGYQWSYSSAIQALKKDIQKGVWGKPLRLKTLCFWPRETTYYTRNDWAGRIKSDKGQWVLDSPANNAMAHFLHNLFYVLGETDDVSAGPDQVTAEAYRAFAIENYDSIACRTIVNRDVELLFYASHAVSQDMGPMFELEFEDAQIIFGDRCETVKAFDRFGGKKSYGSPEQDHPFQKLFAALSVAREGARVICGPQAARSQTLCTNGIQESLTEIAPIPPDRIQQKDKRLWASGLAEDWYTCYKKGILPSEARKAWNNIGRTVDLTDYSFFPKK